MMRSSPNPRANNIWTKEIIEIMIIILASLHFIMSQFYFFRISPQDDRTQDSTPGIVFDSHQDGRALSHLPPLLLWCLKDIGNIYHREAVFLANYAAMERDFKIFVYSDRRQKKCYNPKDKLKSNYASEHHFLKNLIPSRFFTDDPTKAHLFFIPFSCQEDKEIAIWAHVQGLIFGYPFWNRTLGTDHFFFSCHDIVSRATEGIPIVTKNAIRLFCSSNYDSKYIPHKDVSVPQALELSLPPDHGEDVWSW
ncbi:unnamed protein product [Dovyalis caffra]|uniref:Exostosin GT47 domain-containing protein n=1 Tax=Dovyalis caffra TaxID=77055 RepID=A0AAV1SND7_9ROSI|nr:unnamed protein product [Dovyalis caffra]